MNRQPSYASAEYICVVRPPEQGDHDAMADLAEQLGYPCTGKQVRMRLREMEDLNQYAIYVAKFSGGQIAGWICVYLFRAVELDTCAEISGLIVNQQVRSHGIGKSLLDAAEQWARYRGCDAILVRSNVTRDHAHQFYARNGYQHIKTQKAFFKNIAPLV